MTQVNHISWVKQLGFISHSVFPQNSRWYTQKFMPRNKIDCFQIKCVFDINLPFLMQREMKCFITSILPFHECLKNSKYGKDTFLFVFLNALNSIKSITQTHVWYFSKWSFVMQRNMNLYYEIFIFLHIFLLKLFMKSILSA